MLRLRPIWIGSATTLLVAGVSTVTLGAVEGATVVVWSGVLGGGATAIAIRTEDDTDWKTNAHHGFIASGLGGIVVFAILVATAVTGRPLVDSVQPTGELSVFLTTSPMVIPTFATGGIVGSLAEGGFHVLLNAIR